MKEGQLKGRLVAFLPVGGLLTGLVAGGLIEWLPLRFGVAVTGPWGPWLIGGGTGLACGVVTAVLGWLLLDRYLRDLRIPMRELSSLPFGPSARPRSEPARSPAEGLREVVSRLSDVKQRIDRISDRAGELDAGDEHDTRRVENLLERLDQLRGDLGERQRKLEELQHRFDEQIRPVFDLEFAPIKLPGVVEFDRMVSFQGQLDEELDRQLEGWEELSGTVDRLEETPDRLREAVESVNELLLELSDLFQQFPHRELPERAEKLRQHTLRWNQLAERVEEGLETFEQRATRRRDQLGEMKRQVENSRGPEQTWNEVKEELSRVDTIVRRIRQATDSDWVQETSQQLAVFQDHAEGLVEFLEELDQRLRDQQRRVRELESLLRDVESLGQTES